MSQAPELPQEKPKLSRTIDELKKRYKSKAHKNKKTGRSKEEKTLIMISRLCNETRIKRLEEWISNLLLQRTKDLFIDREVTRARKQDPNANIAKIKHQALKISNRWTKKNIRPSLPSHLVTARIMSNHEICSVKEGDIYSTWHIAFNKCGYKGEFPLDKDGLPVEPPGARRSDIMKRVFHKADKKIRKGRFGIVSDRYRERQRNSRSEWRYFLLRYDKGDGKLDDDGNSPGYDRQEQLMNMRHKGEKHQKALLREAMSVPIKKSANMIDSVLDAWTKEQ